MKLKFQLAFWAISVVVLVLLFRKYYNSFSETFYFVSMLLPVVLASSYFFNGVLVPKFLLRGKYWHFVFVQLLYVDHFTLPGDDRHFCCLDCLGFLFL